MKCPRCGQENPPQAKFCLECASPLTLACGRCGTLLLASTKFCPECAHPVGAQSATQPRFASPEAYTPKHLAEKILTSRGALEGERKQVTVLFTDIVNSTGLAERLGAESMHTLINLFFELALTEVHRYEGVVNQFHGDGFMALFGAPLAYEDHARRAVLAALRIQHALRERRGDLGPPHSEALAVRIGLNTGPVVVGKIGENLQMDYTAVGDTTNLAARLQQIAEAGTILLSEATSRLVRGVCSPHTGTIGLRQGQGRIGHGLQGPWDRVAALPIGWAWGAIAKSVRGPGARAASHARSAGPS